LAAGRPDLIGEGCDALIPAQPSKEALLARRARANGHLRGEYVHTFPTARKGYRPRRKTQVRQSRSGRPKH
jgi:hypothetical protein